MSDLVILVGTVTGNAELVAEEMQYVLQDDHGLEVGITNMDSLDASGLTPGPVYLVVTSTYGVGDLPDNAQDFFDDVQAKGPDLSWMRFGVYALGDSVYNTTFCFGGKHFDELFTKLGATRLGPVAQHDASEDGLAEDCGAEWVKVWAKAHLAK
ncbi:MAG: flavodoxin domain-containing protein [Deltaproteobacteria bacterium]|nr:flavodoxin domain-containing protein [Deltaproteobacteria bacterium]